jgi:hypothetical protein
MLYYNPEVAHFSNAIRCKFASADMNKILLVLLVTSLGLFSCNKEVVPLTKEQVNQKIDSLVKASRQESDAQARVDLDRRMKIEVKVKVDSILNARSAKEKKDTSQSKKTPM